MYRIPIEMHNRLMRGEKPVAYAVIDTHMGKRVYAEKELSLTSNPLLNADMEIWSAGAAAAPDNWTLSGPAGRDVARESTIIHNGSYSAKITSHTDVGDYGELYQDIHATLGIAYWQGKKVILGAWVWCAEATTARIVITDGVDQYNSSYHTGSSTWEYITLTATINIAATYVRVFMQTYPSAAVYVAYFDQTILYETSILESSARVLSFGSFERTSQPIKDDVLTAYSGKQIQHMSLQLDNADRYFSRLIAKEPFLGRTLSIYVGFEAELEATHIRLFSGTISEVSIGNTMTIEAEEA